MILVMLASIGGCCVGRDVNGRGERGGKHDWDRSYERGVVHKSKSDLDRA